MSIQNDPLLLYYKHAAELYLIRHGDAIPGPDEIIPSGVYDNLPLSQTGRQQAEQLAQRLKDTQFHAAYSSPLRRCLETGAPLLQALDMQATIIDDLREIRTGDLMPIPQMNDGDDLTPLTKALQAQQMELVRRVAGSGSWDGLSHQETSRDFRRRVVQAIDGIAQQHIGERILIFCHGGVINAYAADVLRLSQEFFYPCANTSINVVRYNPEQRVVFVLNDIAHTL